jgi:hypothetical protein
MGKEADIEHGFAQTLRVSWSLLTASFLHINNLLGMFCEALRKDSTLLENCFWLKPSPGLRFPPKTHSSPLRSM